MKGNFSNLAYSNVQSSLAGSEPDRIWFETSDSPHKRYSFVRRSNQLQIAIQSITEILFSWAIDFEWLRAYQPTLAGLLT